MSVDRLLSEKKYPTSKRRYIGIEIECLINNDKIKPLKKAMLAENLQWNVNIGGDTSIQDLNWVPRFTQVRESWHHATNFVNRISNEDEKDYGMEIRILAEESDGPEIIDKVCKIIKKFGGYVNRTCGLHVHLDMRDRDYEKVFNNLYHFQSFMMSTQPNERRSNKYCKVMKQKYKNPYSRYYAINKCAYKAHRTLEVRLHEGTIDANAIKMWTGFLIQLANIESTLKKSVVDITKMDFPDTLKEYLNERIKKYA